MKPPSPRQRWLILGSLLAVTLTAALLVADEAPETVSVAEMSAKRRVVAAPGDIKPANGGDTLKLATASENPVTNEPADDTTQHGIDPFRSKSWAIAPPPLPPARPVTPPLPFRYLGQIIEDGETTVFVEHQGRHLIIHAGDRIDGNYLVESVAAGKVIFVYLPLKEQQTLLTGPA